MVLVLLLVLVLVLVVMLPLLVVMGLMIFVFRKKPKGLRRLEHSATAKSPGFLRESPRKY